MAHETVDTVIDVAELAEEVLPEADQGGQVRYADEEHNQLLERRNAADNTHDEIRNREEQQLLDIDEAGDGIK